MEPAMGSRGGTEAGEDRRRRKVDTAIAVASPSTSIERRSCNVPTVSAMYGPQGWADLPDGLLHSIIPMLSSFRDILDFAATCPSWRAAFSSYPSKSSFSTLFPPLLLQPDVPMCSPRPRPRPHPYSSSSLVPRRPCYVTNLANQNMYMCCQIPLFCPFGKGKALPSPLDKYIFIGASYGHLILYNKQSCIVVDVFKGASVSPPQLPVDEDDNQLHIANLTAPLVSPNSHLMVTNGSHHFFWRIGSHSWVMLTRNHCYGLIKQLVVFKGRVFCTDNVCNMFIVHLVPRIRIQKIVVNQGKNMRINRLSLNWLVVCGDMLLMVHRRRCSANTGDTFEAFRLDLWTNWVKVENLEKWAIFVSTDERSQALCCMDPERWGGRSNCVYCYASEEWITCELGKPLQRGASVPRFYSGSIMQPMWVVPSMFYPCP